MTESAEIKLISTTYVKDADGIPRPHPSSTTVLCRVRSASASEVFDGGRNGLKPAFTFDVFAGDYCGETTVEFADTFYSVYRTYKRGLDIIELHCEKKVEGNGNQNKTG